MLRITIIITALLGCAAVPDDGKGRLSPRFMVKAEYRQDTLDYDNVEKRFVRESARLSFGASSLSFTHVNIGLNKKENRFTGNLTIRGISPYFDCVIGHFSANFGAGTLVGKKIALSPDLFSRSLAVSRGASFTPSSSGNPYFCFQGIAAGIRYPAEHLTLSLHGYYSFRNRFVRNDRYHPDITGTSLNSILIRTKRDYRYSEPADIQDCGYTLLLTAAQRLSLQSYFIYTFIRRSGARDLLWNFDTAAVPAGEKRFYGYGFYCQYRDDYILIFLDLCFPHRVLAPSIGRSKTVRGYGLIYSLAFRHQACSISFTGKHSGKNFYSPYSSGSSNPETGWTVTLSMRPVKPFTMGCSFYMEKKRIPSGNDRYLRFIRREQLYLRYLVPLKGSFHVRLSEAEEGTKGGTRRYLQLTSSARLYILKSILLGCGGSIRLTGSGRLSGSASCGTRFTLFHLLIVDLRYSRYFIAGSDSLYAVTSRPADSISRGMFIRASSHCVSAKLLFRFQGCRFSAEYLHRFSGTRIFQSRLEASGSCFFH